MVRPLSGQNKGCVADTGKRDTAGAPGEACDPTAPRERRPPLGPPGQSGTLRQLAVVTVDPPCLQLCCGLACELTELHPHRRRSPLERVPESAVGPTDGASAFSHSLPTPPASSSPNKVDDGHVEDVLMKARSLCLLYSPRDTVLRLGEGSPSGAFDSCSRGCLCASRGEGTTAARRTRGEVAAVQV